jgi:antitoxin component YwqK of YwqJK toxin-antitoxin module
MAGRLKRYHGEGVYELIWLLKLAIPCQLAVEGILQEAVDVRRVWHANGQLRSGIERKDGQRHGLHQGWYADGHPAYEGVWKDGQQHGFHREWHENGQIQIEVEWTDGQSHGLHPVWNAKGRLVDFFMAHVETPVKSL